MPKILFSNASPYSAKVRMAAAYAGIAFDSIATETIAPSESLLEANPLGKIPVFIPDHGAAIYDSRVITQFLDRQSGGALFPRADAERLEAEKMEALCDGLCDALLAHVYERNLRPKALIHQPWLDRQWTKAERALDLLNGQVNSLPERIHAGHLALRATLAYLALRFDGKWENGHADLIEWARHFDESMPDLAAYLPRS